VAAPPDPAGTVDCCRWLPIAGLGLALLMVTDRLSPSGVSQLRSRSRPVTITGSPLPRESAR
jgi:hypothetical protein